jgi:hypothetical protein
MAGSVANPCVIVFAVLFIIPCVCAFFMSICALIYRWHAISPIKKLHYIAIIITIFGGLNFLLGICVVEVGIMGGTAVNGKFEQGQFYLGEHGVYTPVSTSTFFTCKYYEVSVLLTVLFSFVAALITYHMQEEPKETLSSKVIAKITRKR